MSDSVYTANMYHIQIPENVSVQDMPTLSFNDFIEAILKVDKRSLRTAESVIYTKALIDILRSGGPGLTVAISDDFYDHLIKVIKEPSQGYGASIFYYTSYLEAVMKARHFDPKGDE